MKRILLLCASWAAMAQTHQLGFTLGRIAGEDRLGGGTALQANYAYRFATTGAAAFSVETHFLANPQRLVALADPRATRDVATIFVTPALRVTFAPASRVQPWASFGGGYALFEHSLLTRGGAPNPAPRLRSTGALQFGGGVDFRLNRWLGFRGEVRNFRTPQPTYFVPNPGGMQNHVVIGGGFTLGFGR